MSTRLQLVLDELLIEQHGAVAREQLRERGFSTDQIDRMQAGGMLERVAPAVYRHPRWPRTFHQRAMVGQLHGGTDAFLTHDCAGLLRDLDGVSRAAIHVTSARRIRPLRGVHVHHATDYTISDWSLIGPLRVATVARTIVDMAATRSVLTLERVFECGNRRGDIDLAALLDERDRLGRQGKRGMKRVRELCDRLVADGKRNGSDAETVFFQILRSARLPLPERQRVVLREDGSHAFTDYAYSDIDAVLEVLGYAHHSKRRDLDRDAERNNDINLDRKTLLEFTWTHLMNDRDYVVRTVTRLLRAHNRL